MTRSEYIKICKTCKNRDFNLNAGIICGLTKSIPDFENYCESYIQDASGDSNEREYYHPKDFKKKDKNIGSRQLQKKLDFFSTNIISSKLIIEKSRIDKFSYYGILALILTLVYVFLRSSDFQENMQNPINLIVWILLILYPVGRFIFPFPKYILNNQGILFRNGNLIKWVDISAITLTDKIDNDDNTSFEQSYFFRLKSGTVKKINLNNYFVSNDSIEIRKNKPYSNSMNNREVIESVIISFYNKFGNNN